MQGGGDVKGCPANLECQLQSVTMYSRRQRCKKIWHKTSFDSGQNARLECRMMGDRKKCRERMYSFKTIVFTCALINFF